MTITYAEPARTGRATLDLIVSPIQLLRDAASLELRGPVTNASLWAQSRYDVAVYLLRDIWGLSVAEAINAATCLVAYCALITHDGADEYNWNVGAVLCVDGSCVRTPDGVLAAFPRLDVGWSTVLEPLASSSAIMQGLRRGDVTALAAARTVGLRPALGDELRASLTRTRALIANGNATTLAQLPGGDGTQPQGDYESAADASYGVADALLLGAFLWWLSDSQQHRSQRDRL